MDFGPERNSCVVKFKVTIEEVGQETVVTDGTTTGNPAEAARALSHSALQDIKEKIDALKDEPQPDITAASLRRAAVTVSIRAGDAYRQIDADTTTNGDVYDAAKDLATAARNDLGKWLREEVGCST